MNLDVEKAEVSECYDQTSLRFDDIVGLRRPTSGRRRDAQDPQAAMSQAEIPSQHVAPREALDLALYVTDMTAQLEAMAVAAGLDVLAYFLGMAKAEADLYVRGNAQADGSEEDFAQVA